MGPLLSRSRLSILLIIILAILQPFNLLEAQTHMSLSPGDSLTPVGNVSSITSPSGLFVFGFRAIDSNSTEYLLSIWYSISKSQPIIWYAMNGARAAVAPIGSTLVFNDVGELYLIVSTGAVLWNSKVNGTAYASLDDTGNFIMYNNHNVSKWQSFGNPTDTLVPGQILAIESPLWSKLTDSDFSRGRFRLIPQSDGNLVLYPMDLITGARYPAIWANGWPNGTQLVFNSSTGALYYHLKNDTDMRVTTADTYPSSDYYQHATLDPDGNFRLYAYPKKWTNNATWITAGQLLTDGCRVRFNETGGICGSNAYCNSNNNNLTRLDCECPPHYSFVDLEHKYEGCTPDLAFPSCQAYQTNEFEFSALQNTDWSGRNLSLLASTNEDQCKEECLKDCDCAAVVVLTNGCWKKGLPLSSGQQGSYINGTALIKVAKSNSSFAPNSPQSKKKSVNKLTFTSLVLFICSVIIFVISGLLVLFYFYSKNDTSTTTPTNLNVVEDDPRTCSNMRAFTCKELEHATNGFSEELGSGAFGIVYKGFLQTEPIIHVAIKKLERLLKEGEKEFATEIQSIGKTHHKNLVRLLGFCKEGPNRMLVYEYMSKGSLAKFLFEEATKPTWSQREKIAVGIARGLSYLHEDCHSQIMHCDIKPQNILLDENLLPKISDFGLAKLLWPNQTGTHTGIRGTKGYVAPEWFKNAPVTAKIDVFSFGVLLLEIVCCRKNIEIGTEEQGEIPVLTFWAHDCLRDSNVKSLVKGDSEAISNITQVEQFVKVAIWCIQEEPLVRPSMREVVSMLEGVAVVPNPPHDNASFSDSASLL